MASSADITDVSAAGLSVTLGGVTIDGGDYMDDESPIKVDTLKTCDIEWSCNGKMIRNATPSAVVITVAVVSGSKSDQGFRKLLLKQNATTGNGAWNENLSGSIKFTGSKTSVSVNLSEGTMIGGAPCCTVRPDGKRMGTSYEFAFTKWT